MTAGVITVGIELRWQLRIEELAVVVRTVEIGMTFHTRHLGAQPRMFRLVLGRNPMTLKTNTIARLRQQPVVRRAVRIVTFCAAAAVEHMLTGHRVFVNERSRFFRVAILTSPIQSLADHRIALVRHRVTITATDIVRSQGMR